MIRVELRRSAALWAGLLVAVLGLAVFYFTPGPWSRGSQAWTAEWMALARWLRWELVLLWPLALAAGAWQGRRDGRAKMDELLTTVPRPAFRRVVPPVVALSLGLVTGYLVIFVVGAGQAIFNADTFQLGWLPIMLVGILSLVAAALLGLGIGRVVPHVLTAPVLAVLGLAAMITMWATPGSPMAMKGIVSQQVSLLSPAFEDVRNPFTMVATDVTLLQGLWFIALAATGFGLIVLAGRARLFALVPALVGAGIVLPLFPSDESGVIVPDPVAAALVCVDGAPRVCVAHLHKDSLATVTTAARQALADLARIPAPPTSVVESLTSRDYVGPAPIPPPGVIPVQFDDPEFEANPRRYILAGPPLRDHCERWQAIHESDAKRVVVASWFDGKLESVSQQRRISPDVVPEVERLWQSLQALPTAEQPARVAELRSAASRCS